MERGLEKVIYEKWKLKIKLNIIILTFEREWKVEIKKWKLKIENWKLDIGNWKLEIKNWTLEIRN